MQLFLILLFSFLIILYEKAWRVYRIHRKINQYINSKNGKVGTIERLSSREEIFSVYYLVAGQSKHSIVKFNLFYHSKWEHTNG